MVSTTAVLWIIIIVFGLACVGLFFIIRELLDKLHEAKKPRLSLNKVGMEKLLESLRHLTLDQRFLVISHLMGETNIECRVDNDGVYIIGAGKIPSQDDAPIEYTG